ncbi:MAG: SRPBCC family protein [Segniliparus sp.]|uniref:SRPBCC family protein n=1 Tax=Segniliparus sp. TaxID=2804064 RepID=UPI003F34A6D8
MTSEMWIWAAVGIVVAAALAGLGALAVLFALAHGEKGPRRFAVAPVEGDLETYFDEKAAWAATATTTVPGTPEHVWAVLAAGGYLALPFLLSGPDVDGDKLVYRGPFSAWAEEVARKEPGRELVTTGAGVSAPLLIKSFGQRFLLRPAPNGVMIAWTVAITPKWIGFLPLRWTGFVARPVLGFVLRRAFR